MENSNKNKECENCGSADIKTLLHKIPICGNCGKNRSPLIPKSEEKKCVECENGEKHGDCTKCGLQTTPIMRCKCPERQSDGSWKAPLEVKPYNLECGKCNRTYKGAELEEPCPYCSEVKPSNGEEFWLKEFYDKFVHLHPLYGQGMANRPLLYDSKMDDVEVLKDFIRSTLSHSKTLILEEVEKKLLKESWQEDAGNEVVGVEDIKTIIKLIKDK
jgi:hypothetical protein